MRTGAKVWQIFAAAMLAGVTQDFAQTNHPGASSQQPTATIQAPSEAPSTTPIPVEPPSLIPPNNLPAPGALPQSPAAADLQILNSLFKQSSLGAVADEHRLHVQLSQLEVQIRDDSDLHAMKRAADHAPTDLRRRQRLMEYYRAYYAKLRKRSTAPDLSAYINGQEANHELGLLQPRVRHETDEAMVTQLNALRGGASPPPTLQKPVQARVNNVFTHP